MNDTDRELLELAARAAGIYVERLDYYTLTHADGREWNPLTSDGDALRLAVKLGITFLHYSTDDWEYCNKDGYSATRRAIVRAAAEIGRTK